MIYCISDARFAQRYDARIELDGASVLLHSRRGATGGRPPRNTEYEKALLTILRRLRAAGTPATPSVIDSILIDSLPARRHSAEDRLLVTAAELSGLSDGEAASLIRNRAMKWRQSPGVAGGNSTKALRIETQGRSHDSIRKTLGLMAWVDQAIATGAIERLTTSEQRRVTVQHIHNAVARLTGGEKATSFADSRDYDVLLDDGTRLAPKQIFGFALEEALGITAYSGHFSAGWSQPCFDLIDGAGYRIVEKGTAPLTARELADAFRDIPPAHEDEAVVEGNRKLATHIRRERGRGLAKKKKAAFIEEHGRLFCERCSMDPVAIYGAAHGHGCIEVHHAAIQLKDMEPGHKTALQDLECLCANCHRVTHRELAAVG